MYNVFCDLCAEQTASGAVSAVSDTLATPIKLNHWKGGKPVERQHVNDNLYNHWYFQLHFFFLLQAKFFSFKQLRSYFLFKSEKAS